MYKRIGINRLSDVNNGRRHQSMSSALTTFLCSDVSSPLQRGVRGICVPSGLHTRISCFVVREDTHQGKGLSSVNNDSRVRRVGTGRGLSLHA